MVTIRIPGGDRPDEYLGCYNLPEARAEYGRLVAELASTPTPAILAGLSSPPPTSA